MPYHKKSNGSGHIPENDKPSLGVMFDSTFLDDVYEHAPYEVAVYARAAIKDMEKRVFSMYEALDSNKLDEAAAYAHAMKSVAQDVGFIEFSEMAAEIEDSCRIGENINLAKKLGAKMVHAFPHIQKTLNAYID